MKVIFLDIETNGLDANQYQALEIAFQIADSKNGTKLAEYSSVIKITPEQFKKSHPSALNVNKFS